MANVLFALIGLMAGGIINILADNLPERMRPQSPYCLQCGYVYSASGWLALSRRLRTRGACPNCGAPTRWRPVIVEAGTMLLFALLPSLIADPLTLAVNSLYIAILILVIVIDLEHRLILNVVTFPVTVLALVGSLIVADAENTLLLALVGGVTGFVLFYIVFWAGQILFGPGALGYGDVKLAMTLGAMLGFHRILFTLALAILIGGVASVFILFVNRNVNRRTYLPYGQYLAVAGILMLIWGVQLFEWYTR